MRAVKLHADAGSTVEVCSERERLPDASVTTCARDEHAFSGYRGRCLRKPESVSGGGVDHVPVSFCSQTYFHPKRPLMQRLPRVTSWSMGEVHFTMRLS